MGVNVTYRCGGCDATETVRAREEVTVLASFGGWDRVSKRRPSISALAPEGWVAFDPYTGCCYCPTCWAEIESDDAPDSEAVADPSDPSSRGRNGV